jgi:prolyl oligopeptidase
LNYDLYRRELQNSIDGHAFKSYLMPISQRGGVQSLESTAERLRMQTVKDYDDWLARMSRVPKVIEQTMARQEQGRKSGYMPPKILMGRIPEQIASQIVENAEDSPFFRVFADMPDSIPDENKARLRESAIKIIDDIIVPAYRKFARYFNNTYLPASRESIGVSELPNGEAYYEYLARVFTTTRMTPDEIHRLGLNEVKRIRDEMQLVIDEVGFDGDFSEFLQFLRTDPQFYYDNPDDLYEAYLATCKRIDPELVKLFGKLPRMPYGLRPIPDNIAPDTTTAYYNRPAADGSRAGYYYVNLYKPEVRPKYEIEVLSVHEAVPGHHLQIALAQELEGLPNFRRYSGFTAFIEGWGLYSEALGYDLGLYKDPYSRFGALTYEMWRAVRLVVDTGMHYKGWTRQQAIDFFKDNAAKTELDIINEIDRYLIMPGQALAYKIGQLKMLELRNKAEQALGDDFDIRAFHDELLGAGALPLEILETRMNRWLTTQME